jgi:16S rRNA processing protein RimM
MSEKHRVLLGEIMGAHGIRGAVMIRSYAANPSDIGAYGPLQDEAGMRSLTIIEAKATPKGVIARIAGVDDRNAAEALKGVALYVERDALPEPEAGEAYHVDLVGMAVVAPDGTEIGSVAGVSNYGASDILEISMKGGAQTELVACVEPFVQGIDTARRRIIVAMPDYLDDEDGAGERS